MVDASCCTCTQGGWDDNVRCTCTHGWCYVFNFSCCTCTHGWCYVFNFSCCTCTQGGGGGGMITFVALAHMVDATSLTLVVALAHRGGGGGGMITFVALAHMVDATSLTLVVALAHMAMAESWSKRSDGSHGQSPRSTTSRLKDEQIEGLLLAIKILLEMSKCWMFDHSNSNSYNNRNLWPKSHSTKLLVCLHPKLNEWPYFSVLMTCYFFDASQKRTVIALSKQTFPTKQKS